MPMSAQVAFRSSSSAPRSSFQAKLNQLSLDFPGGNIPKPLTFPRFGTPNAIFDFLPQKGLRAPRFLSVYLALYRLSWGFWKQYCRVGGEKLRAITGLSRNTLREALSGLERQGLITKGDTNEQGTLYIIRVPPEVYASGEELPSLE